MSAVSTDMPRYGGFWVRVVASFIDTVILLAVAAPILYVLYGSAYFRAYLDITPGSLMGGAQATQPGGMGDFLVSWVLPAVAIVVFWHLRKATPGKMVFSLVVVDAATLGPLTWGQSIGRYLAYFVSMVPFGLGFLWVAFDRRKQGWHDKLAGTVVIYRPAPGVEKPPARSS